MTSQRDLFDWGVAEPLAKPAPKPAPTGQQLKDEGIAKAAACRDTLLGIARGYAYDIACSRPDHTCHMQLVNEAMAADGYGGLSNAAGAVFRNNPQVWEATGRTHTDTRPQAHNNKLDIWRLRFPPGKEHA